MTKKHFQEIKVNDKFKLFNGFLELEEALTLIDALVENKILKFRTNVLKINNTNRQIVLKIRINAEPRYVCNYLNCYII